MKLKEFKGKQSCELFFEKKQISTDLKKQRGVDEKLWKINEKVFQIFCKRSFLELYLPKVSDIGNLLSNSKNVKNKEILQEKMRLIRMIYMICMDEKGFPIFYLKETFNL